MSMNMYTVNIALHRSIGRRIYVTKKKKIGKVIPNLFKCLSWGLIQNLVVSPEMASFPILKC